MLKSDEARVIEARRKAQGVFAKVVKQRDAKSLKDSQDLQAAEAAKTLRLRALRLAKEAADKLAAETKAAEMKAAAATPKRARKAKTEAASDPKAD